jgi:hypothetical protein
LLGPKVALWHCDALQTKEGELIKVASLKNNLIIEHMEEAAATQAAWITPFKYGPLSVLKNVLNDASHGGSAELDLEHVSNGGATPKRLHNNLVVDRVGVVEGRKTVYVTIIKAMDPILDELFRRHVLPP